MRILRTLLESIQSAVASHLPGKLKGVPQNRRATCAEEIEEEVLTKLHDPGDAADELETVFGLALKFLSAKVARDYRKRAIKEVPRFETVPDPEDDSPDIARLMDGERAKEMVEQLPADLKIVAERRLLQNPPTKQADLADELDVRVRTIRNRERAAEAALRKLLGEDN